MKKILLTSFLFLLLLACGDKPQSAKKRTGIDDAKPLSWGKNQTIFVICDDKIWQENKKKLKQNLARTIFTTEEEQYFSLEHAKYENFDKYYRFKNLVLMGALNSPDKTSQYVKSLLNKKSLAKIAKNKAGVFKNDNWLARDQFMLIIAAENKSYLKKLNNLILDEIFTPFKKKLYQRRTRKVYARPIIENKIYNNFPFTLKLPVNFKPFKVMPEKKIFSYLNRVHNSGPDRYITVTYKDIPKSEFKRRWLLAQRKKLAWDLYDEDIFLKNDIRTEKIKFNKYKGFKIIGRWINKKYAVGGAFQTFAFYNDKQNRVYIIDTPMYFPAGFKLPDLIELEIIAKSIAFK